MASHPLRDYSTATPLSRWLLVGFIGGVVGVLVFHQGVLALLHAWGFTQNAPYSLKLAPPWGIPQVWSLAFWGGVWGVALAWALRRWDGPALVASATLFGAVLPTLVAWFVVAPLKGQPLAAGFVPMAMTVGVIVNGAWGLATGLGLNLFGRPHWKSSARY